MNKIDEIDIAILEYVRAQPQRLNDIIQVTKLNYETGRKRLEKLKRYDYVLSPSFGYYAITKPGLNLLESRSISIVAPDLGDAKLQHLIDLLPTEYHKSFFRLLVSGIVAKYLLFDSFTDGYPAFIVGGKTKAFKTSIAKLICLLFGFDNGCIHKLFSATPGEFGIRRVATGNGQFRPEPSQYFNEPFICLDELDKTTSNDLKRVLLNYADGAREFPIEGVQVINHCTTLITLNTNGDVDAIKSLGIHEAYIRRSVVLNTEQLIGQLKDVDLMAKSVFDFMASRTAPRIKLEALMPGITKLSQPDYMLMRGLLMANIAEGYDNMVDTQPLELLSLGRSVLLNGDIREAIFQTAYDRLQCLETLSIVKDGWRDRINTEWAKYQSIEQPEVLERLKAAKAQDVERTRTLEERRADLQKEKEAHIGADLKFREKKTIAENNLKNWIHGLKEISKISQFESEATISIDKCRYLLEHIERTRDEQTLFSYLSHYEESRDNVFSLRSQYIQFTAGQQIKDASRDDARALEYYSGQICAPITFNILDGEIKDADGWRVKLNSGIIEIIKGSQRWPFKAQAGRFKLGNKYAVFIKTISHNPERIIMEVGSVS
ncbi:MAG: hypothetical protein Q7J78_03295 [Clostridiales bacterium]|nr:hypothetical protein [Clostridiales bacterium]